MEIDAQLEACGWVVQDYKHAAVAAAQGVAVREVPTEAGPADYVLFVDRQAVGVIEAKKAGRAKDRFVIVDAVGVTEAGPQSRPCCSSGTTSGAAAVDGEVRGSELRRDASQVELAEVPPVGDAMAQQGDVQAAGAHGRVAGQETVDKVLDGRDRRCLHGAREARGGAQREHEIKRGDVLEA